MDKSNRQTLVREITKTYKRERYTVTKPGRLQETPLVCHPILCHGTTNIDVETGEGKGTCMFHRPKKGV